MEDINRIPPHSVESEQSILGSIILDKEAIITVAETIQPMDFYKEAHKIIYESTKHFAYWGFPTNGLKYLLTNFINGILLESF